jgi:hypothetical protein
MSKPYVIEDYNVINNQLMAHEQRGRPCSEYVESVGDDVRAGDFITFSSVTCSPALSGEKQIEHSVLFPVSSSVGQVLGFLDNEGGDMCCKVNIYWKQDRVPRRVTFPGVVTVPDRILFVQTNVTVVLLVRDIKEVALVLHRQHFTEDHNGFLNVFAVQNQVDCNDGVCSVKAVEDHRASSQDLHRNLQDFASLPVLMYRTCLKVYHACATMLCRIAASQLPTNLCKIDMHPGIWRMIKHHLQHKFRSNNHPFYIDSIPTTITTNRIQFANDLMELQTRILDHDPDTHYTDRVKCYTSEMIAFLQLDCFGATFGVGARLAAPAAPEPEDDEIYNSAPVSHGTRVNIITHLPLAENYGPAMTTFRRAGVDGLTLLYERHSTQLIVKLRYDSPLVEDAIVDRQIPNSYSNFPMPLIGFLYNRDGHTHEVVNYDGGETVGVVTDGRQYHVVQVNIREIFIIMHNTLLLHRQRQDVTAVETAVASVAAAERLLQIE